MNKMLRSLLLMVCLATLVVAPAAALAYRPVDGPGVGIWQGDGETGEDGNEDAGTGGISLEGLGVPLATEPAETEQPAPDDGLADYGEVIEGTITDQAPAQSWDFRPGTADRIRIRVERTSGNLIPDLSLLDSTGTVVGATYGADRTGAVATLDDFTLSSVGPFEIVVARRDGPDGVTTGDYRLTVELLAVAADAAANTTPVGAVEYGVPVQGEITPEHWRHIYTLEAESGDLIAVTVEREDGTLWPEIDILDANAAALQYGYADRSGVSARIDSYALPGSGVYQIIVRRARGFDGASTGAYSLTVTLLGSGEDSARLRRPAQPLEGYDQPVQGEITNEHWYEDWQLVAQAGDMITVRVQRSADDPVNTLSPELRLLGAAGQVLQYGYVDGGTYDRALIERYTLDGPGTYTIRVQREREKSGSTTGTYELVVELVGAGEGGPTLQGATGTVVSGAPVEGEVTAARWADTWTYRGTGGETLDVRVERTDGTLIPYIEIQDQNGQALSYGYADRGTGASALIEGFNVRAPGEYRIVVMRDGEQGGYTTGAYRLSVQARTE